MIRCASVIFVTLAIVGSLAQAAEQYSVHMFPVVVVNTEPEAGDTKVDPGITEIRVCFSKRMLDGNWSWVQRSDDTFPETTGKPRYLADGKTCVLPVKLEPSRTYVLEINSLNGRFGNFKDRRQQSAVPYLLVFKTRNAGP